MNMNRQQALKIIIADDLKMIQATGPEGQAEWISNTLYSGLYGYEQYENWELCDILKGRGLVDLAENDELVIW